jgi:hypothetical protein
MDLVSRMRLAIADKSAVVRAIAAERGAILGGNDTVTWCFGPMLYSDAKGKPDTTPMRGKNP